MSEQTTQERKTYYYGLAEGRKEGARQEAIHRTTIHLRCLMSTLHISLEEALITLQIPKSERNTYRKIFTKRIRRISPIPEDKSGLK